MKKGKEVITMTQVEMEAEVKGLSEQVLKLEQQQEGHKTLVSMRTYRWMHWHRTVNPEPDYCSDRRCRSDPPICAILVFTALQLYILCIAISFAGRSPGSIGSRL